MYSIKQEGCASFGGKNAWPTVATGISYLLCFAGRRFFRVGLRLRVYHGVLEKEDMAFGVARGHLMKRKTSAILGVNPRSHDASANSQK